MLISGAEKVDDTRDVHEIPARIREFFERSRIALTLADSNMDDVPIVLANVSFSDLTGYPNDEVVGRNCRFLQPEGGGGPVRKRIRAFLSDPKQLTGQFVLPNLRADGEQFANLLYLAKVDLKSGGRFVLGSQFNASRADRRARGLYDLALSEDVTRLANASTDSGLISLGTYDALAHSAALIARGVE